jgi:hypothetical protein
LADQMKHMPSFALCTPQRTFGLVAKHVVGKLLL